MSEPKRYTDLQVWEALHFAGSTNGWIRWDDYARLKAEVERLRKLFADTERLMLLDGEYEAAKVGTYANLQAEVERLRAASFVTAVPVEQYERVIKAGQAMADVCGWHGTYEAAEELVKAWEAAKDGKPSV